MERPLLLQALRTHGLVSFEQVEVMILETTGVCTPGLGFKSYTNYDSHAVLFRLIERLDGRARRRRGPFIRGGATLSEEAGAVEKRGTSVRQ